MSLSLLKTKTHYSILQSLIKPSKLAAILAEKNITSCAITDNRTVAGAVEFSTALKEKNIKPIIGCEFYIRGAGDIVVLAKNKQGWYELIKLVSISNNIENIGPSGPGLNYSDFSFTKNLICMAGHYNTILYNQSLYMANSVENSINKLQEIFGKENFFIEIQNYNKNIFHQDKIASEILSQLAIKLNIKRVAACDPHFLDKNDLDDIRLLLCNKLNILHKNISNIQNYSDLNYIGNSNLNYILSKDELLECNSEEEIDNNNYIASLCENYNLTNTPQLPKFDCPNNLSEIEYITELARTGYKDLYKPYWDKQIYGDRVKREIGVIDKANLAGYFLIVQDYVNWAKSKGILVGCARGCLHPDVRIRTSNGLKKIKDISLKDKVYSINGDLQSVKNIFEYSCSETLISIKTYYGDCYHTSLTNDHKILAEKCIRPKNYNNWAKTTKSSRKNTLIPKFNPQWIRTSELKKDDWVTIDIPNYAVDFSEKIDLADYCKFNDDCRITDKEIFFEPKNRLCNTIQFSHSINRFIKIDKTFIEYLGYWTGDGWINKNTGIASVYNTKDIDLMNKHIQFFKTLGINASVRKQYKDKQCIQVIFPHKVLMLLFSSLFNNYKNSSNTKHVPKLIYKLSKELIKEYIIGYSLADGSYNKNRVIFCSISEILSEQIRELLLYLGIPSSRRISDRRRQKNISNLEYYVTCPININNPFSPLEKSKYYYLHQNKLYLKIKNIELIKNEYQKVYDLEIENTHNYCTSNFLVHNSAAGSLVSYLLRITNVDPIPYNLLFERFYNDGRNTKDRIALPDIDIDFPIDSREEVISYVRNKYGYDKVAQIATFGRMQGRGAVKDVFRIHDVCDMKTINEISKKLPHEHEIADKLEEEGQESIIQWTLDNEPERISEYCRMTDGEITGDYAQYFKQASRLEGIHKSQGKHAAGIIIAPKPLSELCPMIADKSSNEKICGMEMDSLEKMGLPKMDFLGIAALDKLSYVNNLLEKINV